MKAAGGKNVEVFSPTIGRQLLELGLVDEIDLHIAPIMLGQGIRLYDNPGCAPIRLHRVGEDDPLSVVNVRYRPTTTAKIPPQAVSGSRAALVGTGGRRQRDGGRVLRTGGRPASSARTYG